MRHLVLSTERQGSISCQAQKHGREFDVRGQFTSLVGKERYGGKTFGNSMLQLTPMDLDL
eukprot:783655-Rhodomonas_salina.1